MNIGKLIRIRGQLPHLGRSSEPPNPCRSWSHLHQQPSPTRYTIPDNSYMPSQLPYSHTGPPTVSLRGTITAGWLRSLGLNMPFPPPPTPPSNTSTHTPESPFCKPFPACDARGLSRSKDQGRKPGCGLCDYNPLSILVRTPDVSLRSLDAHPADVAETHLHGAQETWLGRICKGSCC